MFAVNLPSLHCEKAVFYLGKAEIIVKYFRLIDHSTPS